MNLLHHRKLKRRRRGSALIAILWVVAILSLVVFSSTQFLFIETEAAANGVSRTIAIQIWARYGASFSHLECSSDPITEPLRLMMKSSWSMNSIKSSRQIRTGETRSPFSAVANSI